MKLTADQSRILVKIRRAVTLNFRTARKIVLRATGTLFLFS